MLCRSTYIVQRSFDMSLIFLSMTMNSKRRILFGIIAVGLFSLLLITTHKTEKTNIILSPSETLTDDEGYYYQFCRCHSDGECMHGYPISFRPSCATHISLDPTEIVVCSDANINCPWTTLLISFLEGWRQEGYCLSWYVPVQLIIMTNLMDWST